MPYAPYDVVLVEGVQVGKSDDPRPAVILRVLEGKVSVVPLSSQPDLCNEQMDIVFDGDDPDFPATGLGRTSRTLTDWFGEWIRQEQIVAHKGRLQGDLAWRFSFWCRRQGIELPDPP